MAASDGEEGGTEDPEVGRTRETEAREGGGGSPSRTGIARDGETVFERTEAEMALDAARERITGLEAELEIEPWSLRISDMRRSVRMRLSQTTSADWNSCSVAPTGRKACQMKPGTRYATVSYRRDSVTSL